MADSGFFMPKKVETLLEKMHKSLFAYSDINNSLMLKMVK